MDKRGAVSEIASNGFLMFLFVNVSVSIFHGSLMSAVLMLCKYLIDGF